MCVGTQSLHFDYTVQVVLQWRYAQHQPFQGRFIIFFKLQMLMTVKMDVVQPMQAYLHKAVKCANAKKKILH